MYLAAQWQSNKRQVVVTHVHIFHTSNILFRHLSQTNSILLYRSSICSSKAQQALLYIFLQFLAAESYPGVGLAIFSSSFPVSGCFQLFKWDAGYDTGGSLNKNPFSQHSDPVPGHAHTISAGVKTSSAGRLPDESLSCFLKTAAFRVQEGT